MTVIVGIDPGGRSTGIVVRDGASLLYHDVVERSKGETMGEYLVRVCDGVKSAKYQSLRSGSMRAFAPPYAVEDLNDPNPHMGIVNLRGLIDTAQVLGVILHVHPSAIVVPPGRHGSAPLKSYPAELVGAREAKGTGRLRHCRSAWDIASVGLTLHKWGQS